MTVNYICLQILIENKTYRWHGFIVFRDIQNKSNYNLFPSTGGVKLTVLNILNFSLLKRFLIFFVTFHNFSYKTRYLKYV